MSLAPISEIFRLSTMVNFILGIVEEHFSVSILVKKNDSIKMRPDYIPINMGCEFFLLSGSELIGKRIVLLRQINSIK